MSTAFTRLGNGQPDDTHGAITANLEKCMQFVETSEATGVGDIQGVTAGNGLVGGGTSGTPTLKVGVAVYNETGGTLTKGTLVHLSGFDGTNGVTMTLADADNSLPATHVLDADIATLTAGTAYPVATVTGLNTNGRTIGDKAYLSGTAGTYTYSEPTGANQLSQIVGIVKVVSATVGEIVFFPGSRHMKAFGTSYIQDGSLTNAKIAAAAAIDYSKLASLATGHILAGNAGVPTDTTMSGDVTIGATGVMTIGNNVVTGQKVADSAGTVGGYVQKFIIAVYDFAVSGGAQGAITLPTAIFPDNAVVWLDSYDVITTFTSASDAATVKLGAATDGDITTAIAISDASNPWDAGAFSRIAGGLATPLTKKMTGNRAVVLTIAGGENITAGKAIFKFSYWISE